MAVFYQAVLLQFTLSTSHLKSKVRNIFKTFQKKEDFSENFDDFFIRKKSEIGSKESDFESGSSAIDE